MDEENKEEKKETKENISLEDTMESITPIMADVSVVSTGSSLNRGEEVEKLLAMATNVNSNKLFHESTCEICGSPYRKNVEEKYDETDDFEEAQKEYISKSGKDIERSVIENHIRFHARKNIQEIQKVEYAQKIKRLSNQNFTTLDTIGMTFAFIVDRIIAINSCIPSKTETIVEVEKIKASETARLSSVLSNLMKLQAQISGEMKLSGEILSFPRKEFIDIFIGSIQASKTDREREALKNVLDQLETLSRKIKM
jgi:hypothetical protein